MIPLMMEHDYRATGWLGLIMGTRLYFNFHPAAVDTDAAFMQQVDNVERELGNRGKTMAGRVSKIVPPALVARSMEPPSPALAPAPVRSRAPAPALAPAPAPARTPALTLSPVPAANSFTPSMQLHSPEQRSTDDASLVQLLLERETMMRLEAKAETDELRQEMEKMREGLQPARAISEHQVTGSI